MGIISKIIIVDKRGYIFTIDNEVLDDSEDDFAIIQKSLHEIANGDAPNLYELERKSGIIYVKFIRQD